MIHPFYKLIYPHVFEVRGYVKELFSVRGILYLYTLSKLLGCTATLLLLTSTSICCGYARISQELSAY